MPQCLKGTVRNYNVLIQLYMIHHYVYRAQISAFQQNFILQDTNGIFMFVFSDKVRY